MYKNDFSYDQDRDFIRVFNSCYFSVNNDENIMHYKTVYYLSYNFKIICLLSPPSTQPTANLACSLVRPNVKVGQDRGAKTHDRLTGEYMNTFMVMVAKNASFYYYRTTHCLVDDMFF